MEEYTFEPVEVVIHWYIRLRSWLISKHDNRALFRQFVLDQHLDKLEKENISYSLPKSYPIITNEISRLYNIRDQILIKIHHDDYSEKQIAIDNRMKELENEHDLLKKRRIVEKDVLKGLRIKRNSIKIDNDLIAMESRISKAASALDNTETAIKNCETKISSLKHTKKDNESNWDKQIALLNKTIEIAISNYIKRATKKIELKYGFTEFTHFVAEYGPEMQKVLKGEY